MRKQLEKHIEQRLVDKVRQAGGEAYKFISPGKAGVPDRIVVMPGGKIYFVELKKGLKCRITARQKYELHKLAVLGHEALILWSAAGVDEFIKKITRIKEERCEIFHQV